MKIARISILFALLTAPLFATASGSYLDLYCDTYEACRAQFRASAREKGATIWSNALPSRRAGDDLTVDFAFFPSNRPGSHKLLLLTSGIHGLEGFTGSTLQTLFMQSLLAQTLDSGVSVLMVHGLNAYGFKYGSRYTENRVDLNRNWFASDRFPVGLNDRIYDRFNRLLNPRWTASYGDFDFAWFLGRHLLPWLRSAENGSLTQAAGQGQFRYARGVEFGGFRAEPQRELFLRNLAPYLKRFDEVMHFDLHTGLGRREMQLLPNAPKLPEIARLRQKIFEANGFPIQSTGDSTFYSSYGDFSDFVCDVVYQRYAGHHCVNMLLEYGTLLETYWQEWPTAFRLYKNNIEQAYTLYLTIRENQAYNYGVSSRAEARKLRADYRALFYPTDHAWRVMVMSDTLSSWPKFIASFSHL